MRHNKIATITLLALTLGACSQKDATENATASENAINTMSTEAAKVEVTKSEASTADSVKPEVAVPSLFTELDWSTIPDLKDIGNFPFFTAPQGFKINNEKEGLSELFDYEKLENYTGAAIYTTEGKLGILDFDGADDKDFNQRLFDKSVYDFIGKMGAKLIFKGEYPANETKNEATLKKLEENMWGGKHGSNGLLRNGSDSPIAVYAFKNNGKNYMVNIQSNSAQGTIFIMELQSFVQTMKKYTAEGMKKEIDAAGKAILNINFDTDKATLKPDGQTVVDEILALLNENPTLKISIEGHTDNTGAAEHNKKLSADRANTVMHALAANGIDIKRLKVAGFGADKPLSANDTDDNKAKNRRVELVKF